MTQLIIKNKTFMKQFKVYLAVLLIGFTQSFLAQNTEYEGQNTAIRHIAKSEKVSEMPESKDSIFPIDSVRYYIEPKKYDATFETEPISAARLKVVEPLEKLYAGYVKAGIGTYAMPYLEAYYNSLRSKNNAWGVNVNHLSALTGLKGVGNSTFSNNNANAYYKHFSRHHSVEFKGEYTRDKFHYYGFNSGDTLIPQTYRESKDTISQVYNRIGFTTRLKSSYTDSSKLNHDIFLRYKFLNSLDKVSENNIVVGGNLFKYMEKEQIGGSFEIDFNSFKSPFYAPLADTTGLTGTSTNSTIFKLNPNIHSRGKDWEVKAGIGIQANITYNAKFHFYPDIEANYRLFNNVFVPYISLTGGLQRNSFNSLQLINPFILTNSSLLNTNQKIKFQGGIRGSVSSTVSFNAFFATEQLQGLPLFYADSIYSYGNKFTVVYDTVTRTNIGGQIEYQKGEKIKVFARGDYFMYSTRQPAAWGLPDWKFTLSGRYDLADKIIATMNVFVVGNRKAVSTTQVEGGQLASNGLVYSYNLKPFVDANLGFEYRYNKRLSAYINFNNLVTKKYQYWQNVPVQSINIFGGVTYKF